MESKILDSDSDEDKPLSEIRKKHVRQSLFQSDEDSNDDPLFEIKDVDINSTDSEYEDIIKDVKRNSKMKGVTRDKAWKKKPSTMTNKKRNTPGWPKKSRERFTCKAKSPLLTKKRKILLGEKHSNIGSKANKHGISPTKKRDIHIHQYSVEKAKQESMRQQRALVILQRFHERTLDTLLNSNGLQRYSIPRNGNCFFEAIVKSSNLTKFKSHKELRESLCDYMCANKHCFTPFLTMSDEEYFQQVEYLRKDGNWSNDLADSLPLAAANVLGRDFKIFTSDRKQPIIQVTSSVRTSDTNDIKNHMALGYIKMRGVEHYDACFPKESRIQTPAKPKCIEPVPNITPRKQACYISPVHKKRTRKRKANPEMWKKNIRKRLRLSGKSYISSLGKEKPEKSVKVVNCSKCRFKCTLHISHQQRECIFNNFWGLGSNERQKDFLCSNIKESSPKRVVRKAKSHRSASRIFSFSTDGIDNVRVCKSFFLKTLDVSERSIESAMKNKEAGVFVSYDGRGKHTPHNKIPDNIIEGVRRHIESFPTVEAHYTRKQTNKLYLEPDLNISKMYDLYKESCQNKGAVAVSKIKYRKIFCEEYNISFHKPKKDQCQVCAVYQDAKLKGTTSHEMDLEFSEHQRKKERARQEKELDKQFAKEHSNYHSAVFDLEAVLPVPCSLVSQVYYKENSVATIFLCFLCKMRRRLAISGMNRREIVDLAKLHRVFKCIFVHCQIQFLTSAFFQIHVQGKIGIA